MQMLYEELQRFVVSGRQLPQEVLELEEDAVELHADLSRRHWGGAEAKRLQILHNSTLAFFGQTDELIVVAEKDEWLWKLKKGKASQVSKKVNVKTTLALQSVFREIYK